jgi:hypothetical protein
VCVRARYLPLILLPQALQLSRLLLVLDAQDSHRCARTHTRGECTAAQNPLCTQTAPDPVFWSAFSLVSSLWSVLWRTWIELCAVRVRHRRRHRLSPRLHGALGVFQALLVTDMAPLILLRVHPPSNMINRSPYKQRGAILK